MKALREFFKPKISRRKIFMIGGIVVMLILIQYLLAGLYFSSPVEVDGPFLFSARKALLKHLKMPRLEHETVKTRGVTSRLNTSAYFQVRGYVMKAEAQNHEFKPFFFPNKVKRDALLDEGEKVRDYFRTQPDVVNPHNYRVLLQPNGCNENEPFLLILVLNVHEHFAERRTIRETWGGAAVNGTWPRTFSDGNNRTKVYFLLGKHPSGNATLELKIRNEANKYNDILQEDFVDTYENLPKKSIMGLKWASTHCQSAQYIMKTDDDTFINVGPLIRYIKTNQDPQTKLIGVFCPRSVVIRGGRWGVPVEQYPFYRYPPYVSGGPGYLLPANFAPVLHNLSLYVPEIKMEDVYVTGILTKISQTIRIGYARGFQDASRKFNNACGLVSPVPKIAVTGLSVDQVRRFWDFILRHKGC